MTRWMEVKVLPSLRWTLKGIGNKLSRLSVPALGAGPSKALISLVRTPLGGSNVGGRSKAPPRDVW